VSRIEEQVMKHVTFSLALLGLFAASAVAQNAPGTATQPGQPRQGAVRPQPGQPGAQGAQNAQAGNLDHDIAAMIALGNQEEITLAQFAQKHAKHERVKEFAEMMQRDHTQALQKLQQVAPQVEALQLAGAPGGAARAQAGNQPGSTVQQAGGQQQFGAQGVQPAGSTQAVAGGASPRLDLFRAIHAQCLALTQRELEEAGDDFDACYVGQQVGAHVGMLAKLQASEQFATGELRGFIQEATQTVEGHLQHAKELAKELKNAQASNGNAQREGESRR
jgi:predicted outer membrane protein